MSLPREGARAAEPRDVTILRRVLVAGILVTLVHYADNYLYFEDYPQPASLRRWQVYTGWLLLTAIGVAGYRLYARGRVWPAYACLVVYSYTGTSSLGHYLYGALSEFSAKQHVFILSDGLSGLAVLAFVVWSMLLRGNRIGQPSKRTT